MSGMRSGSNLSPGCRDRLAIASSLATILALLVGVLGLARAMLDVTWPVAWSGTDLICTQFEANQPNLTSSMLAAARASSPTISVQPTAAFSVTVTPMPPAATSSPTITPQPPPATAPPAAAVSETMSITTQVANSATAAYLMQAPVLLSPSADAALGGEVHFEWQWDGEPLPEGLAFDLLIWSEAEEQEHQGAGAFGVIELTSSLESDVDLDYVQSIMEHGAGIYYWTVVVVTEEPYERVGLKGEKRAFVYALPEPPAESPTESP